MGHHGRDDYCDEEIRAELLSLTFTDVYSGWTENRATYGKNSDEVLSANNGYSVQTPPSIFCLLIFNTDNGTEFLNRSLYMYFSEKENIEYTRSRLYKKNDICHIEQKNI